MKCHLCPRKCSADRAAGEVGFCGCSFLPKIGRAAPHFWEEPCLSGVRGSGTVFFTGCNLGCVYCQNRPLARNEVGTTVDSNGLSQIFLRLQEQGVHNINLVTPTPFAPVIREALTLSFDKGLWLPVIWNSGGYDCPETIVSMRGMISIYLPDFKYMDRNLAARLSHAPDYPDYAKASLAEMVAQRGDARFDDEGMMTRGVIVRHLVLPGEIDNSIAVLDYLHQTYREQVAVSIMSQYTPMPGMTGNLARTLTEQEYRTVVDYAKQIGISNGFIQEGTAASESFIPTFEGVTL